MAERLLRLPEVERRVGLRRSAIYARIQRQEFPAAVKLGHTSAWIESEVSSFIDTQIRASRECGAEP